MHNTGRQWSAVILYADTGRGATTHVQAQSPDGKNYKRFSV